MTPEALFSFSGPLTMVAWVSLLLSPLLPRLSQLIAALVIPGILSIAYIALILVNWTETPGGFDSLANVMLLFDSPAIALAGWLHYLAFDLLIGAWIVRTSQTEMIPHILIIPCLALTFMFGPAGFAVFTAIRYSRKFGLYKTDAN